METTKLAISEIFHSVQGEGPSLGRQAIFLRLAACNLTCQWCDTKYTWDWKQYDIKEQVKSMTLEEVDEEIFRASEPVNATQLLVVTGGEPLLQQYTVSKLSMFHMFWQVEFETNGTLLPLHELIEDESVYFNVSPKLANSVVDIEKRIKGDVLNTFASLERARFKFVAQDAQDLKEIKVLRRLFQIEPEKIWIMPLGTSTEQLNTSLASVRDEAINEGYNLTTRLHIQLWGNKRGV